MSPDPDAAPGVDPQLEARLARLQQRRTGATPSAPTPAAETSPRRVPRRRHAARGARAGSLLATIAATGGLSALLSHLDAARASQVSALAPGTQPPASATTLGAVGSASASAAVAPATTAPAVAAFAGPIVNTRYGPVQVQAQFNNGRLADVSVLRYPQQDGKSVRINARALPTLRSEALTAQSASVHTVSGATYTSDAYERSLQASIDQARAANATAIA